MSYRLQTFKEKRFSTKILVGKLRRLLPAFLYNRLIDARYFLFSRRCQDLALPQIRYSDGSWVNRKTTADLRRMQDYLLTRGDGLTIFQAGIGNSSLYRLLRKRITRFVGVTISPDEMDYAAAEFPEDIGKIYQTHLTNKYTADIRQLGQGYDYIVDNDISAYACCHHHFHKMLDAYRDMLKPDGAILVGYLGLGYFDMGFGLTEMRMRSLARHHGLTFERGEACYFLKKVTQT
jgi:hypothetical protein